MAKRILVYGVTGSGKTTLAARIAERTGLPWHAVDDLTWEPGSDSIIRWHFHSFARKRARISAWADQPSGPAVERLKGPADTERWLASLSPAI